VEGYNLQPDGTTPSFIRLNAINAKSVLEAGLDYQGRGFVVTPLHGKRPVLARWQQRILRRAEFPRYFTHERNVGVVLGGLGGVVDVDLDNPAAVDVADLLLPDTLESGRAASPRSHRWYLGNDIPAPRKYALPKLMAERLTLDPGEATLIELRSAGQLTMVPPSVHPVSGDRDLWYPGEIRSIDGKVLADLVLDVALAALLAINCPLGSRTWFAINAAGYLSPHLGYERTVAIVETASAAIDDEEHDERMEAVRSSVRKPLDDAPIMEDLVAAELEKLAPGVPALIDRWCARERREGGGAR
jgi:hypothetical protein